MNKKNKMITYENEYKHCLKTNKIMRYKLEAAEKKLDKIKRDLEED